MRELVRAGSYTATLIVNGAPSTFSVIIPDGSLNFSNINTANLQLNALDLVSIQITYTASGALSNGVCATLIASSN